MNEFDQRERRRQEAVKFAVASVGLEGFELSAEYLAETERFIRGEIELEDLKRFIDRDR